MSDHAFNPFIAKKYGVIESILINNFIFWTRTNAAKPADQNNFFDERFWVFGTPLYFKNFFIYLTERQIKYGLSNLAKAGALLKGNYNKKGYDKTKWYALSDQILNELNLDRTCLQPAPALIGQICPIHRTNLSYASDKFGQPIPDTKPDTKLNKKLTNCEPSSSSFIFSQTTDRNILNQKLDRDPRTDEQFLQMAIDHIDKHSQKKYPRLQRAGAFVKLLKQHKIDNKIFYVAGTQPENPTPDDKRPKVHCPFTADELCKASEYHHALNTNRLEIFFPKPENREIAREIHERVYHADKGTVSKDNLQHRT